MDRRDDRDRPDGDAEDGDADRWDRSGLNPGDPAGNGTGSGDSSPGGDLEQDSAGGGESSRGPPNDGDRSDAASVATEGEEWRISTDDLGRTDELSPGDPDPENVLFVLLGVAFALAVLAQFVVALP